MVPRGYTAITLVIDGFYSSANMGFCLWLFMEISFSTDNNILLNMNFNHFGDYFIWPLMFSISETLLCD